MPSIPMLAEPSARTRADERLVLAVLVLSLALCAALWSETAARAPASDSAAAMSLSAGL